MLARLTSVQEKWASQGQRVLLLARKAISGDTLPQAVSFDSPEFANLIDPELNQGLTVVGLVGLVDPPRDDIPEVCRCDSGDLLTCRPSGQCAALASGSSWSLAISH